MISNFRIHISSVSIFRRRGKNKRIWKRNMEYRCRYDLSTLLICIRFHSYLMLSLFLKAANVINSIELQATHKLFARDYMQSCQDYCIWFIQYVIYLVFQHNKRCKITPKILPKGGGGGCVYWITEGEYCCTLLSLSLARTPILFYYFVLPGNHLPLLLGPIEMERHKVKGQLHRSYLKLCPSAVYSGKGSYDGALRAV
ncbi:uncharacterized protein LOC109724675 isoform X4 [Ananas comosus]|uniref:Uncharacterized protein LOC109724675 isoform X4 n=1 Tax=Ananas comosus TaxID=4615 RepID=A0A6P5GMM3_ANACO|nr:uncharacterized protein LOC109724675 isoform X4 [Ananas comosus]